MKIATKENIVECGVLLVIILESAGALMLLMGVCS